MTSRERMYLSPDEQRAYNAQRGEAMKDGGDAHPRCARCGHELTSHGTEGRCIALEAGQCPCIGYRATPEPHPTPAGAVEAWLRNAIEHGFHDAEVRQFDQQIATLQAQLRRAEAERDVWCREARKQQAAADTSEQEAHDAQQRVKELTDALVDRTYAFHKESHSDHPDWRACVFDSCRKTAALTPQGTEAPRGVDSPA